MRIENYWPESFYHCRQNQKRMYVAVFLLWLIFERRLRIPGCCLIHPRERCRLAHQKSFAALHYPPPVQRQFALYRCRCPRGALPVAASRYCRGSACLGWINNVPVIPLSYRKIHRVPVCGLGPAPEFLPSRQP